MNYTRPTTLAVTTVNAHLRLAPFVVITSACVFAVCGTASAGVVAEWTFDARSYEATAGTGSAGVFGTTLMGWQTGASGAGEDGALRVTGFSAPKAKGNPLRGLSLTTCTDGWEAHQLTWLQRVDARASAYGQLQYSIDGANFTSVGLANNGRFRIGTVGQYQQVGFDLSHIEGATDNPDIAFRIVAVKDLSGKRFVTNSRRGYQAKAGWTLDHVVLSGSELPSGAIPAPGAAVLAALAGGLGGLMGRRRDRLS